VKATAFLGGGRITSALIAGLRLAGYDRPLVVHDRNPRKLRDLNRRYGVEVAAGIDNAVTGADRVIVAVRPDSVRELLGELQVLEVPPIGISLAAGIPLSRLKQLAPSMRWARAMPSPVCRSGHGLIALVFEPGFPQRQRQAIEQFFGKTGVVLEVPENQFDIFTVTYSSSHGYHALSALAQSAEDLGLSRRIAMAAAAHALADGIQYWRDSKTSLPELLHEATTPGGIAGTVMATMESAGYGKIVKRGLLAGLARARKNSRS
jgi:pyrroline-5-carboxylate reductase